MIREIGHELLKMGSHKKSYIPIAGYILFVLLCYIAFKNSLEPLSKMLKGFTDPKEAVRYLDGFFFARILFGPTFIILMPIVMAAIGGDCVAGEIQDGSLKLYMSRSRSRTKVILTKFAAIYTAGFLYCMLFACAGLTVGYLLFGMAPVQLLLVPATVFGSTVAVMDNPEAVLRYFGTALYFSFSLMTMGSLALFFSTLFNRMSSAAIAVITIYFVSYIIITLPFGEWLRPWLISEIMNNGFLFWLTPLPMGKIYVNLATLGLYICSFLMAAIITFNCKDIR
ncbi:MAG: ABC transporter permease subunit [Lentisphaeria bacterium]|nr:ABC transporter permease subunit [Lentisphaeria bacterium]